MSVGACEGEQLVSLAVLCRIPALGNAPWCQMDTRGLWREEEGGAGAGCAENTRDKQWDWERRAQVPNGPADEHTRYFFPS